MGRYNEYLQQYLINIAFYQQLIKLKPTKKMKLSKPKKQLAEVLYELIKYKGRSTLQLMNSTGALCPTKRISDLRLNHSVLIKTVSKSVKNKYGRVVKYGVFTVVNKDKATEVYNRINK